MKDRSALARGWFLKADCDLTDLTAYAVELRYDAEFWPPQPTAVDAVTLAERVRAYVLTRMPSDTRP